MASGFDQSGSAVPANWVDAPTFYTDGVIGSAQAGGVQRILLGSVTFNAEPGSLEPTYKPVCELVLTNEAVKRLIEYLRGLSGVEGDAA